MKTKTILIIVLINLLILPNFIPTISWAYEELEKKQNITEDEVEKGKEELERPSEPEKIEGTKDIEEEQEPEKKEPEEEKTDIIEEIEKEDKEEEEFFETDEQEEMKVQTVMRATVNTTSSQLPEGDGIYAIVSVLDTSKAFTIDAGSKDNSANLHLWVNQNVAHQKFQLQYNSQTKAYTIIATHSNKVLDVAGGGKTNGTNVQQFESNGTEAQQWVLQEAGNGYFYIMSKCNGLYLDVTNADAKNGANLQLYMGNQSTAQKFKFTKIPDLTSKQLPEGDGIYAIVSALDTSKAFTIDAGSKDNSANLHLWVNQEVAHQKFELQYNSQTKAYTIIATHSNKVLDVAGGGKTNGTNVQQFKSNGTEAQQWVLQEAGNGCFYIMSKCNGLYLDVTNADAKNGANIQLYMRNQTNAQKFKFIKQELKSEQLSEGDGTYVISSALNHNEVLNVDAGSKENYANVHLWNNVNVKQEQFNLKYNATTKTYTILANHSNKALDVAGGGKTNGTNVQQFDSNGSLAQQWVLQSAGNGYYYIVSKGSGLYLDVAYGVAKDGANIQIYEGNHTNAQKFKFTKVKELISLQLPSGNGKYTISTALNENKVLDIAGGSYNNAANVQIWGNADVKQQKFELKYNAQSKTYTIQATHSNKVLDVAGGGKTNGTNVQQFDSNGTESQQWVLEDAGNGYYYVIAKNSGLYLNVENTKANDGTNVGLYQGNKSAAQKFKFTLTGEQTLADGFYVIKSALNTNYVLDVEGGSKADKANVQLYTSNNSEAQKWQVKYLGNGRYTIMAAHSGKVLDVAGGGSAYRTNVQQFTNNNTIAQQWILQDAGNGYFNIVSMCNQLYLDVSNAIATNGANIQIYAGSTNNAQKFKFEKTNSSNYANLDEGKYPGYKSMLQQLQNQHPNWSFQIYYTGLDWNAAVNQQDQFEKINDPRSLVHEYYYLYDGGKEWIDGFTKYDTSKEWYKASTKGIAYMMDPRNSLTEKWVFQFQDLTDSSATKEEILKMLSKVTFLKNKELAADTIVKQCAKKGVNPFHIVARMVQEQGNDGSYSNGFQCTHSHRNTVYNLFNIRVSGSNGLTIGANYACDKGWLTQEECIEGSIDFIKDEYIGVGQSTLYFQKYNVVNQIYNHQYMTNIYGANDEGNKMYQGYNANNLLNREFKFVIPVYENMPSAPSPRPGK